MTETKNMKCDTCGKIHMETIDQSGNIPYQWYKLEKIKMLYGGEKGKVPAKDKNILDIDESKDPDFCSRQCLDFWLKHNINKITVDLTKKRRWF